MPYPEKFSGFQVKSAETWQEFHKQEFDPKPFGDYDIDIKIECCGVCSSDVHTVRGDWGAQPYPLAVGHGEFGPRPRETRCVELTRSSQRLSARRSRSAPR